MSFDNYISGLASEINTDPLTRNYAGMTDEAVAADLNTQYRPDVVPAEEATQSILQSPQWTSYRERGELQTEANTYDNPNMRAFVDSILAYATGGPFDLSETGFWGQLTSACVVETTMGATARNAWLALRENRKTRGVELFGRVVRTGHVTRARAL